jgi:hypothetical protein
MLGIRGRGVPMCTAHLAKNQCTLSSGMVQPRSRQGRNGPEADLGQMRQSVGVVGIGLVGGHVQRRFRMANIDAYSWQ